jgi:K+-transporting ATPase ATPase A chain
MGPVASLESIKHLGTNGGGFFSMNAAHPFENPTPLTNLLHILSMLLIPAGMTYAFGSMLLRRKQGWVLFAACMVMFVGFLSLVFRGRAKRQPAAGARRSRSAIQPDPERRQYGGQGAALRHCRYGLVRGHHHGGHHGLGQRHA